jgi:Ca2+-binding RTX toxin-like protein
LTGDDTVGDGETLGDEVLLGLDGRNLINGGIGEDIIHGGHDSSGDILIGGDGNDVIFGGSGNDDLQGGDGADNFIMSAGFGRDDVDGGNGTDIITLNSLLSSADLSDIDSWLTLDGAASYTDNGIGTITLSGAAPISGIIDLGGNNEITFQDIEQIVYTDVS